MWVKVTYGIPNHSLAIVHSKILRCVQSNYVTFITLKYFYCLLLCYSSINYIQYNVAIKFNLFI